MTRLRLRGQVLELGSRPLLMGIVNAAPDSFSDGDDHPTLASRVAQGAALLEARARQFVDAVRRRDVELLAQARRELGGEADPLVESLKKFGHKTATRDAVRREFIV